MNKSLSNVKEKNRLILSYMLSNVTYRQSNDKIIYCVQYITIYNYYIITCCRNEILMISQYNLYIFIYNISIIYLLIVGIKQSAKNKTFKNWINIERD